MAIAIGGLPGTGKSTLARALAPSLGPAPGALVLRSDEIRNVCMASRRKSGCRHPPIAPRPTSAVAETQAKALAGAVAGGHAVIADATFLDIAQRDAIACAAGSVPFLGVWLQAPLEVLEKRVAGRRGDASDADTALLRRLAPSDPGPRGWLAVDATDGDAALAAIRAALGERR